MHINKNQQGFAVIEAFLILVVLAIIGFTGYFVYHTKQTTDKTLTDTGNSTLIPPKKTDTTSTKTTTTQTSTQSYLTLTGWGVKVPVSGSLTVAKADDESSAYGEDVMVVTVDPSTPDVCKGGAIGWILRTTSAPDPSTTFSYIGSDYYVYQVPQDCMVSADSGVMAQLQQAVGKMVAAN